MLEWLARASGWRIFEPGGGLRRDSPGRPQRREVEGIRSRGSGERVPVPGLLPGVASVGYLVIGAIPTGWVADSLVGGAAGAVSRVTDPSELGGVVMSLASDHASYVSGATLNASGGFLMY